MSCFVYILESVKRERFYIGSSMDPIRRLYYHNTTEKGFTSRYRPWKIVFTKEFHTKTEAMSTERMIKRWKSRKMVEKLIQFEINL